MLIPGGDLGALDPGRLAAAGYCDLAFFCCAASPGSSDLSYSSWPEIYCAAQRREEMIEADKEAQLKEIVSELAKRTGNADHLLSIHLLELMKQYAEIKDAHSSPNSAPNSPHKPVLLLFLFLHCLQLQIALLRPLTVWLS